MRIQLVSDPGHVAQLKGWPDSRPRTVRGEVGSRRRVRPRRLHTPSGRRLGSTRNTHTRSHGRCPARSSGFHCGRASRQGSDQAGARTCHRVLAQHRQEDRRSHRGRLQRVLRAADTPRTRSRRDRKTCVAVSAQPTVVYFRARVGSRGSSARFPPTRHPPIPPPGTSASDLRTDYPPRSQRESGGQSPSPRHYASVRLLVSDGSQSEGLSDPSPIRDLAQVRRVSARIRRGRSQTTDRPQPLEFQWGLLTEEIDYGLFWG